MQDNPVQAAPFVNQPRVEQERELVKWIAASRPYKTRDRQFFTTVVVIAVLVSILLMFAREWMLIAVVAAMIFAYYVWSTVPPEEVEHTVTTRGIRVHGQLYKWEEMDRWWMEDKWGYKMLLVDVPATFPRRLHMVVANTDVEQVKKIMGQYVLMESPIETPMDKAGKWLAEKFPLETR